MILTVTLNAAIDKRYVVAGARDGEVNRVLECSYTPGGKGLNVSKPAVIAGAKVVATGFTGGYAGRYIEESIREFGIENRFYHIDRESRSCINIWDCVKQQQTEYLEPGFTVSSDEYEGFRQLFGELVQEAELVVMSGSVPAGLDESVYPALIREVKRQGKKVILDTSGNLLTAGILAKPTMIKPNIDEIRMLTGKSCDTIDEIIMAARGIHASGIEYVVVSLGAEGAVLVCEEGTYRARVPKVDAQNTVGCGDSMTAGFAIGLAEGQPAEIILKKASAISAAAALCKETGFFEYEEMERLLPQIQVDKLPN